MDPAVALVKTYLEFCGYFVLCELPVREPYGAGYRDATDLDVVAVRFPHPPQEDPSRRGRALEVYLGADPELQVREDAVDVIIGEVKEGRAHLNRGLRRAETIGFALRRIGCCPPEEVPRVARKIASTGALAMEMAGRVPCHIRVAVFAGRDGAAGCSPSLVISLDHVLTFLRNRLKRYRDILGSARFKDCLPAFLVLEEKLAQGAFEANRGAQKPQGTDEIREGGG